MDVWYTPERLKLYGEIAERRKARYLRRMARIRRQRRWERVFGSVKAVIGYLVSMAIIAACLFVGALWASM